jgi:hypothetical protein
MIEIFGVAWGTPAQIISAVASTGIFAGLVTLIVGYWRRGVDIRAHENADEFDIRKHLADELEKVYQRQIACEGREEKLRVRVRNLEDHLEGVYRTLVATSAEKVVEMRDDYPEHVVANAERTLAAQRKR